jgi:16S rRNA (guanine966-N2)-methyltransferase
MGDRVRSALFNILGDFLTGAEVLDAFAGSGALGLESLSRGARSATFIEKDRRAAQTVVKNTTLLNLSAKSRVINTTVERWLRTTDEKTEQFDIIFADPPYQNPQFSTVFKLLDYLKPDGLMVLSYAGRTMCVPTVEGVVVVDKREYGEAGIAIFKKASC